MQHSLFNDGDEFSDADYITEQVAGHTCRLTARFIGQYSTKVSTPTYHSSIYAHVNAESSQFPPSTRVEFLIAYLG